MNRPVRPSRRAVIAQGRQAAPSVTRSATPVGVVPARAAPSDDRWVPAHIWSGREGVLDVADEGLELRRGHVIWSDSPM